MALIRTIAEAKAAYPRLLSNLSNTAALPDFDAAENKYLIPFIGAALYDSINGKLNSDPAGVLTAEETAILPFMRRVSVTYTYLNELGSDNAKITDTGVRSMESATMPRVFGWQYKELKESLTNKAADAVEVMLKYLFSHANSYPSWVASAEYARVNSLLIKTGTDFTDHYPLNRPNRVYYSLIPVITEVQEELITAAIGESLLNHLTTVSDPDDALKKILKRLKRAVANQTVFKACKQFAVMFDENGFTFINAGADTENPDQAGRAQADVPMFTLKMDSARDDAEAYLKKAKKLLVDYRASGDSSSQFNTAFDDGPLVSYINPATLTRGNETRKIFRM